MWFDRSVPYDITTPRKAEPGDAVAIVSPSFAAPEFFPAVHEQAMQRLTAITGPAGRFALDPSVLNGGVLLLETSEELIPAREFGWIMRSLGERGVLAAVDAVVVARPPAEQIHSKRTSAERQAHRAKQCDTVIEIAHRYNPDAVVCVGPPFGHTRPQWIVPYGGTMTIDGTSRRVWADYG